MAQLCDVPIFFNWILKLIINLPKRGRSSSCRSEWEFCHCFQQRRILPSILLFSQFFYSSGRAAWHVETSVPVSPACHSSSEVGGASPPLSPPLPTDVHLGKIALISSASEMKAAIKDAVCSLSSHAEMQRSLSPRPLGLRSG